MTFSAIILELQQIKSELDAIKPIKLESKIQWTGLIGAAQNIWADKKANKLCNTVIIGETNYLNLPSLLAKRAKMLEEHLHTTENVNDSIDAVMLIQECYNTWNAICPEIAQWTVNEEQWNGHPLPLYLVIKHHLYHSFNEYKLPESLRKENEINMNFIDKQIEKTITPAQENNSGCFGAILLIAIPLSVLYFLF